MQLSKVRIALILHCVVQASAAECAHGGNSNTCLAQHCGGSASITGCLENGSPDGDCCAMPGSGSCKAGFTKKANSNQCHSIGAITTCCLSANVRAGDDCSPKFCTSPNGMGGTDCMAGSDTEPCSCSEGRSAKTTGKTEFFEGKTYYEYTCCTSGGEGEECGDYKSWTWLFILIVVLLVLVCVGCIIGGICCCWCMKCCCFEQKTPPIAAAPVAMVGQPQVAMVAQPPVVVAAPVQVDGYMK